VGAQQILLGAADIVLVGGAEDALNPMVLSQMAAAGVLGTHPDPAQTCRPFSRNRNGTILGEGSAFLVLESARSAHQRGRPAYSRLAGWASGSDGYQRTRMRPNGDGLHQVMTDALQMAAMAPEQIGYVHAHGTGTVLNDGQEAKAMRRLFPQGAACSSTKPITGHCMGAAAALGAIVSIEALRQQWLPPSANCQPLDPDCEPALIHPTARSSPLHAVMSNALGFWGHNVSLIFSTPDPARRCPNPPPAPLGAP